MIKTVFIYIDKLISYIVGAYLIYLLILLPYTFSSFNLFHFIGIYSLTIILLLIILFSLKNSNNKLLFVLRLIINYVSLLIFIVSYYQWSLTGFDHF